MIDQYIVIMLSALLTYFIGRKKVNIIVSSAAVTLCLHYATVLLLDQDFSAVIFGASFVGMSTSSRLSPLGIFIASNTFFAITFYALDSLPIIGGTLGFIAFISCSLVLIMKHLLLKNSNT